MNPAPAPAPATLYRVEVYAHGRKIEGYADQAAIDLLYSAQRTLENLVVSRRSGPGAFAGFGLSGAAGYGYHVQMVVSEGRALIPGVPAYPVRLPNGQTLWTEQPQQGAQPTPTDPRALSGSALVVELVPLTGAPPAPAEPA